jgi:hypothetical protein
MKLYEVKQEYDTAVELALEYAEANNGELPEFWDKELEALEGTLDEKRISCAHVYKNLSAEADAIKAEEKKLAARRKALENAADRVKGYLAVNTPVGAKISAPTAVISWRKSEQTIVDDVNAIPEQYKKIVTTVTPDKVELKKAIKAGCAIEGAHIEEVHNLQIK